MALIGPKYEQSAVDIISPMLSITQQIRSKNDSDRNVMLQGVKGLGEAIGKSNAYFKRKEALDRISAESIDGQVAEIDKQIAMIEQRLSELNEEKTRLEGVVFSWDNGNPKDEPFTAPEYGQEFDYAMNEENGGSANG